MTLPHTRRVVRVEVPARPQYLRLLRVTAAAAAADEADEAVGYQRLDDVRLAIDELAAGAIAVAPPDEVLRVDISMQAGRLEVRGRLRGGDRAPALSIPGRHLMATVCPEHDLGIDHGEVVFGFVVQVGGRDAGDGPGRSSGRSSG